MKKIILYTVSILAMLSSASCGNSELEQKSPKLGKVTFKVGNVATRTEFADPGEANSAINWQTDDKIGIFDKIDIRGFSLVNLSGNTAEISGQADVNASDYYGIYPYSAFIRNTGSKFTFNIRNEQVANENNFDPAANISLAHVASESQNENVTMRFNNVGAWFQINASISKINDVEIPAIDNGNPYTAQKITYTLNSSTPIDKVVVSADEPLSGWFSKSTDDVNSKLETVEGNNSVSLKGVIKQNTNYFICIPPCALKDNKINFHISISPKATKTTYSGRNDHSGTKTDYTAKIVGSVVKKGTKDLVRNTVYKMPLSGLTLTPEYYYDKTTGAAADIQDGSYILVVKETQDDGSVKFYCQDNSADIYKTIQTGTDVWGDPVYEEVEGYDRIDVTKYYDSNTKEFYIPSNASEISGKVINITLKKDKDTGKFSVDGFPYDSELIPNADKTQYYLHICFGFSTYDYVYYDTKNKFFPQTSSLPSADEGGYEYFSLFSFYKLNVSL